MRRRDLETSCSILTLALALSPLALSCDQEEPDDGRDPKDRSLKNELFRIQDPEEVEHALEIRNPRGPYCSAAGDWDEDWALLEAQVLVLVNQIRDHGTYCGRYGYQEPAPPLTADAVLRCSARLHSKDMAIHGYFGHTSRDGRMSGMRMVMAGFEGHKMGENIAAGSVTPAQTVRAWLRSDGHCRNIMDPEYEALGVGFYDSPKNRHRQFWTQNFGGDY